MGDKKREKNEEKHRCECCNFECMWQCDFQRHLSTRKHKMATLDDKKREKNSYICSCGKVYKHRGSISKHRKLCEVYKNTLFAVDIGLDVVSIDNNIKSEIESEKEESVDDSSSKISPHLVIEIMKQNNMLMEQNQEFKSLIIEQNSKFMELKQNVIVNNTTNNNFNLNVFLNEKCKDAISMIDFVNSLQVGTMDVEYTGVHGYVEGITKIFIDGLKQLDVYKRPIHCTDLKRETLYIKEDESWEKDNQEKTKFKKAIGTVVRKNMLQIKRWQEENPRCNILDSNEYVLHMSIMRQSLGGGNQEKTDRNNEKIIKNIAKQVVVDRTIN
jgi:hypothetical protein